MLIYILIFKIFALQIILLGGITMVVEPKVRGFICVTAHPEGCKESVRRQIEYAKAQEKKESPKKVLIIGSSTGYGLASRISAAYIGGAQLHQDIIIQRLLRNLPQRTVYMQRQLTEMHSQLR